MLWGGVAQLVYRTDSGVGWASSETGQGHSVGNGCCSYDQGVSWSCAGNQLSKQAQDGAKDATCRACATVPLISTHDSLMTAHVAAQPM